MFNKLAIKLLKFNDRKFFKNYTVLIRSLEMTIAMFLAAFLAIAIASETITKFIIFTGLSAILMMILVNLGFDQNDLAEDARRLVKIDKIKEIGRRQTTYDRRFNFERIDVTIETNIGLENKVISNKERITVKDFEDLKNRSCHLVSLTLEKPDIVQKTFDNLVIEKIEIYDGDERLIPDSIKNEIELVIRRVETVEAAIVETIDQKTSIKNVEMVSLIFEVKSISQMLDRLCELK